MKTVKHYVPSPEQLDIIMSYDSWEIGMYNKRYYVHDISEGIVMLVKKVCEMPSEEYEDDIVDLGGAYDGETDDLSKVMSFELVA